MANNRIGDECWWHHLVISDSISDWKRGRLLAWSTDYEELRDGVGQYPVAIVEDLESGRVHSLSVHMISFGEKPIE